MVINKVDGFSRIDALDAFHKELDSLYKKSSSEKEKYLRFLYAQLHKIDNLEDVPNREEPIKYKDVVLYSIRKRMKKNTRVLYYCKKDNRVVLLTAFDEKNSSDYQKGKENAYNRLKTLNIL